MNISTKYINDFPKQNKPSGAYEWWYFDAMSVCGNWGVVIIFYQGNPFSPHYIQAMEKKGSLPDEFPALSISVYHHDKTEYYAFLDFWKDEFSWDEESRTLKIGKNNFSISENDKELTYYIELDQALVSGHSIKAKLIFESKFISNNVFKTSFNNDVNHQWDLSQPVATVGGSMLISAKAGKIEMEFDGIGYHDHNVGMRPMKDDFKSWYWGRCHFKNHILIYYALNGHVDTQYEGWLLDRKSLKLVQKYDEFTFKKYKRSLFGLTFASTIALFGPTSKIYINQNKLVDNGPFYQRFNSTFLLKHNGKVFRAKGFTEYIVPSRIYLKRFWPAVYMRLRNLKSKPHWVQKIKTLYEWTW